VTPHLDFAIAETTQVGEARRAAAALADAHGFDETAAGRLALVVNELGNNLVRHAVQGRLLIGAGGGPGEGIDVISIDKGPGMADVNACLRDGFSTGGTPGTGLGATQRLADRFSIHSQPGRGTLIAARVRAQPEARGAAAPAYLVGAIALAAPGEFVCGDAWIFEQNGAKARLMVADGLGHGPQAAEASDAACKVFSVTPGEPLQVLERAHTALKSTRGAAVAVATLDSDSNAIVFGGAGNIAGRILSGVGDRTLLSQHGTVGLQMRRQQDVPYDWPDHALLVMHSDGFVTRWTLGEDAALLQSDPVLIAAWLVREHVRGRDDATVVVVRRSRP
jgi:anti-sigma regulatory factor (Ser/Thr protein kinase)